MASNKNLDGETIYDESGDYGTCDRCGRTLNDNVDQGDVCYGCVEAADARAEEALVRQCPYCRGMLQEEVQPDGCIAYIPHDHTDDSGESLERPRADY